MINYQVTYEVQHESESRFTRLQDGITVSHEMSEWQLERELSVRWAIVKGETNMVRNLTILVARETI